MLVITFVFVFLIGSFCSGMDETLQVELLNNETNFPKYLVVTEDNGRPLVSKNGVLEVRDPNTKSIQKPRNNSVVGMEKMVLTSSPQSMNSRVCCWLYPSLPSLNAPLWPLMKPLSTWSLLKMPALPTWKPIPTMSPNKFQPFKLPNNSFSCWLNTAANRTKLPEVTYPTYTPTKSWLTYPTYHIPTWIPSVNNPVTALNYTSVPFKQSNYTWTIPTLAPLKPLHLYPAYHMPTYVFEPQHVPSDVSSKCPFHHCNLRQQSVNLASTDVPDELPSRPDFMTFNINNVMYGGDRAVVNHEAARVTKPLLLVDQDSIGLETNDTLSMEEIWDVDSPASQVFDVGNTKTTNTLTRVVLNNNCGESEIGGKCEVEGQGHVVSGSVSKDKELTLMSSLLQTAFLPSKTISSPSIGSGEIKPENALKGLKSQLLPSLYNFIPFFLNDAKRYGLKSSISSRAQPDTPSADGSLINHSSAGAAFNFKRETSPVASLKPPTKPLVGSQITIPGSVGVEDSIAAAASY